LFAAVFVYLRNFTAAIPIITTNAAWNAIVNAMSDRPQRQLGWSNISIERAP
jgi:hypothetical protein